MTNKREDEFRRISPLSGRFDQPDGLQSISGGEIASMKVDRTGRLYWDGKPVPVKHRLTFWQTVGAFTVGTFIVIGAIGSFLQGWASYHDLVGRARQAHYGYCLRRFAL
jgi:hypothetical protein